MTTPLPPAEMPWKLRAGLPIWNASILEAKLMRVLRREERRRRREEERSRLVEELQRNGRSRQRSKEGSRKPEESTGASSVESNFRTVEHAGRCEGHDASRGGAVPRSPSPRLLSQIHPNPGFQEVSPSSLAYSPPSQQEGEQQMLPASCHVQANPTQASTRRGVHTCTPTQCQSQTEADMGARGNNTPCGSRAQPNAARTLCQTKAEARALAQTPSQAKSPLRRSFTFLRPFSRFKAEVAAPGREGQEGQEYEREQPRMSRARTAPFDQRRRTSELLRRAGLSGGQASHCGYAPASRAQGGCPGGAEGTPGSQTRMAQKTALGHSPAPSPIGCHKRSQSEDASSSVLIFNPHNERQLASDLGVPLTPTEQAPSSAAATDALGYVPLPFSAGSWRQQSQAAVPTPDPQGGGKSAEGGERGTPDKGAARKGLMWKLVMTRTFRSFRRQEAAPRRPVGLEAQSCPVLVDL